MSDFNESEVRRANDGRFAEKPAAAEADVALGHPGDEPEAPMSPLVPSDLRSAPRQAGTWTVSDPTLTHRGVGPGGFPNVEFHVGGEPHRRVANRAAAQMYRDVAGVHIDSRMGRLAAEGKPMTVLAVSKTGTVKALEGRGYTEPSGRAALIAKGSRSRGYRLDDLDVIDVTPGYGGAPGLDETWRARTSRHLPATSAITDLDDVPDVGEDDTPDTFAAAYLVEHEGFGSGPHAGCMFLATDRQTGDGGERGDIVNGYFWAPGSAGELTSERSSMYSSDLMRTGAKIDDFDPSAVSPADCWKTMPPSRTEAYRQVVGRSFYDE